MITRFLQYGNKTRCDGPDPLMGPANHRDSQFRTCIRATENLSGTDLDWFVREAIRARPLLIAMSPETTPFAALTLIAAPAILTNACSVLILSTSNRMARAVDRARELVGQTEKAPPETVAHYIQSQRAAENRAIILAKALRLAYGALGGFAGAACVSVFGALATSGPYLLELAFQIIAIVIGIVAVISMVAAAVLLVHESRSTIAQLQIESEEMERRRAEALK